MARTRIMSDAVLGLAVDKLEAGGFVLVDVEMDEDLEPVHERRDVALDAFERARRLLRVELALPDDELKARVAAALTRRDEM